MNNPKKEQPKSKTSSNLPSPPIVPYYNQNQMQQSRLTCQSRIEIPDMSEEDLSACVAEIKEYAIVLEIDYVRHEPTHPKSNTANYLGGKLIIKLATASPEDSLAAIRLFTTPQPLLDTRSSRKESEKERSRKISRSPIGVQTKSFERQILKFILNPASTVLILFLILSIAALGNLLHSIFIPEKSPSEQNREQLLEKNQ